MRNPALQLDPTPQLCYGYVEEVSDHQYRIAADFGTLWATQAVSCLLAPQTGDRVLLAYDQVSTPCVLAILERTQLATSTLDLPGDATIRASGDLHLAAARELTCSSESLSVGAEQAQISVMHTSFLGNVVSVQAQRIKSVFVSADQVFRDLSQRIGEYFRATSEHEEIQSRSSRKVVEEDLSMQSRNTVIVSEKNVKIDGELVHLG